jgi:hypothetical protein
MDVGMTQMGDEGRTDEILYAHIYVSIGNPLSLYHIRLHVQENKTAIRVDGAAEPFLYVPGFPISPQNIDKKLKLYLTFS